MKNVLIVFTVLAMASVANAGFMISVNGVINPPDSQINLKPSETAIIDIHGANNTTDTVVIGWLLLQGIGAIDASTPILPLWASSTVGNMSAADKAIYIPMLPDYGYPGVKDIVEMGIMDTTEPFSAPNGLLIDGIKLHCEGFGDVTLTLLDAASLSPLSRVVIHQIPEPITFALLGLGGLFLRRRK